MSQHQAAGALAEPLVPPSPRPPPDNNELATVREAQRQQCVRSPILDMVLRFIKPRTPDDDHPSPSPSSSSSTTNNNGISTRRFRVLSPAYPMHVRVTKDGKKKRVRYPDNSVSTAKYNVFTFLPRALFEQFRRLANIYFLVVTVLMLIGTYSDLYQSPLTPFTTLIPLCVVLAITMGKEAFEDLKRHTADQKTNNRAARVLRLSAASASSSGGEDKVEVEEVFWKNIGVGRIVKVLDKEEIPADMILLTSSEPGGNCYIETSNIDGETSLKIKEAARTGEGGGGPAFVTAADVGGWEAAVECEAPNSRIHTYTGTLLLNEQRRVGVNQANLLLRGSRLRNTKWVLGLVVYTGYDTKIVMNSRAAPSKLSTIEVTTNRLLYLILGMQIFLVTVTLGAYLVWTDAHESQLHYLCMDYLNGPSAFLRMNCQATAKEASELGMWVTFLLLYNNFVPISLYVTVEMVNYIQAYYIDQDLCMYDPSSDTPALARTSNMNGDLGSVRYVFSDKTGTLTRNIMEFRRCSVGGVIYGNLEEGVEEGREEEEEGQQIEGEEERTSGSSGGSGGEGGRARRPSVSAADDPFVVRGESLKELAERSMSCGGEGGKEEASKTGGSAAAAAAAAEAAAFYFAECLAVCHTVVVEKVAPSSSSSAAAIAAAAPVSSSSSSSSSPSRGADKHDLAAAEAPAAPAAPAPTTKRTPLSYQAESPDEEALVEAAAHELHWSFLGRTPTSALILTPQNQQLTYQVLAVLPFTSTRKRMSVIVRTPQERIVLLTKGADNVIFERASSFLGTTRQALDAHLSVFAADGLRTLVLARKELDEDEFNAWLVEFQQASTAVEGRSERLAEVGEKMERGLVVVGATAIEDKLQEGVPETIAHLLEAGIKVWVLTGDKVETAINIAYSCRLLHAKMTLIKVIDPKDEGGGGGGREEAECDAALRQQLRKLVTHFEQLVEDEALVGGLWASSHSGEGEGGWKGWLPFRWCGGKGGGEGRRRRRRSSALSFTTVPAEFGGGGGGRGGGAGGMLSEPLVGEGEGEDEEEEEDGMPASTRMSNNPLKDVQSDHLALIIDGPALARVFGDWEMERLLLRVATLCKSVVACRVSPAQKRMLIRLVKKGVKHPTPITLAIGDGANDVAMIQEAQVGVGISGREGRQAVNSADFAIAQFRFLEPLLLKHGRWSYRRTSKVILYSFYKNIVLTFVLFAYTWLTGFSGQSLLEDYVYTSYNFMLAMPPICFGLFDRDLSVDTIMGTTTPTTQRSNKTQHATSSNTTANHTVPPADDDAAAAATAAGFRWAYMSGRDNLDLNLGQMALWLLQATIDSILIFGFSFGAMAAPRQVLSPEGDVDDLYMLGLITFTGMLIGMLYKAATNTYTWTWVNFFFFFGSALLFVIFLAIYGSLPIMAGGFYGVPGHMARHPSFWLVGVVLVPTVSVIVDYVFIYLRLSFFPSPVDIAVEYDRGYFIPKATATAAGAEGGRARTVEEEEAARGDLASLKGAAQAEEEAMERRRSGWYPGKLLVGLPLLRRLNARISQKDKEEMGLTEAEGGLMPSSYDYTSSSFDLGPGAGSHGGAGGGKVLARRHSRG